MLDVISAVIGRMSTGLAYSDLPAHTRDEILDAMSATSKTDIR
ncbi:hypothetical protein [Demequina zhanjiangensis]|uniref:Uncharacterized protein n=1 Tax=Demequina zhanjiangensis TaxID=3051659 RepID=A0ABT8FYR2_9MICO|nr:hypothetical protein [Demequina sp. SYSU T00b26]MDN4472036.1 hypothetical protein [Demequina sp. SYSU T00b26]